MSKDVNECCPIFNPKKWDKKTYNWENKLFIRESIPAFFHIPFIPMISKKMIKMIHLADEADANLEDDAEMLILFHDPTAFKSEIYYSVTKNVEGADNYPISGTFVAGVFDGPYNKVPVFMKEMDRYLAGENKKAKDYFVHYAYCPKCAEKYKHNYMILFARV